jgi:hypothetical protein
MPHAPAEANCPYLFIAVCTRLYWAKLRLQQHVDSASYIAQHCRDTVPICTTGTDVVSDWGTLYAAHRCAVV